MTAAVGPAWQRVFVSGAGASGAAQSSFSIAVAAGQTVDVWGLQVEAQPYPSAYKQTSAALRDLRRDVLRERRTDDHEHERRVSRRVRSVLLSRV